MLRNSSLANGDRLFGSSGVRGIVGERYEPGFVAALASAYASWLGPPGLVLVAHDFRTTSVGIARIAAGALQMLGFDAVELGAMPTPCLQFNVPAFDAKGGLMVTASHNPPQYNGIKFVGPRGLPLPAEAESEIEELWQARTFVRADWMSAGTLRTDSQGVERYLSSVRRQVAVDAVRRRALPVVLDPGNGASAVTSPRLLKEIGCRLVTVNSNPDGWFPGRPSEPTEENLAHLASAVMETGAAVGIAHDGDADRVAFVDEKGRFVRGDRTLALLARHALRDHAGGTVVTTVASSSVVQRVVEGAGGHLVVTATGSRAVAAAIERTNAVFGGEENGHCYWPAHLNAPDGPMSSAKMLELLAAENRPLSELVGELPPRHLVHLEFPVREELLDATVEEAARNLATDADRVDRLDGVKAFFRDGWVLVRRSGTEPLVRLVAEGSTDAHARSLAGLGAGAVRGAIEPTDVADPTAIEASP